MRVKVGELRRLIREGLWDTIFGASTILGKFTERYPMLSQFEGLERVIDPLIQAMSEANFRKALEKDPMLVVRILREFLEEDLPGNLAKGALTHVAANMSDQARDIVARHWANSFDRSKRSRAEQWR